MLAEDAAPNRLQRAVARGAAPDPGSRRRPARAHRLRRAELHPGAAHRGRQRDPDVPRRARSRPRQRRRHRTSSSVLAQGAELLGATTDAADRVLVVFTDGEAHDTLPEIVRAGRSAQGGGRPADRGGRGRRRLPPASRSATRRARWSSTSGRGRHGDSDPAARRHAPRGGGRGGGDAGAERRRRTRPARCATSSPR